ncbi:hypothetical protein B0H10DRAFT_2225986 [Mycena sp. CBHHK59/15]|nr:hypothetical protein B0H10DRAFT_2225986 [Mycena sp. CBHHK59/15]
MKIPSSSSLIFATLAISSSSSTLAAPAGDPPNSEASMTSSPSGHARRDSTASRSLRPSNMQQAADAVMESRAFISRTIEARTPLLGVLGSILGPPLASLGLCPTSMGAAQAMEAQSAFPVISNAQAIDTLRVVIAALQEDASTKDASDDSSDFSSSTLSSDASTSTTGDSSSSATDASYGSATASPFLPGNPPNTPAMSSTTTSAEPTDAPFRRDLPIAIGGVAAVPLAAASMPTSQVGAVPSTVVDKVPPPAAGVPGMVVGNVPSPVAGAPGMVVSNVPLPIASAPGTAAGNIPPPVASVPGMVVGTAPHAVGAAKNKVPAPLSMRRWISRAVQAPAQVPAPVAAIPSIVDGAISGVAGVPSIATNAPSMVVGVAPVLVAGTVAGVPVVGGVPAMVVGVAAPAVGTVAGTAGGEAGTGGAVERVLA